MDQIKNFAELNKKKFSILHKNRQQMLRLSRGKEREKVRIHFHAWKKMKKVLKVLKVSGKRQLIMAWIDRMEEEEDDDEGEDE